MTFNVDFDKIHATSHLRLELPSFRARPDENIENFLSKFELFCSQYNKDDQYKNSTIPFLLHDRAFMVYNTLSDEIRNDYAKLSYHLRLCFGPTILPLEYALPRICALKMIKGSTVQAFYEELTTQCSIYKIQSEILRALFMNGLTNNIRTYVTIRRPSTLSDALKYAKQAEGISSFDKSSIPTQLGDSSILLTPETFSQPISPRSDNRDSRYYYDQQRSKRRNSAMDKENSHYREDKSIEEEHSRTEEPSEVNRNNYDHSNVIIEPINKPFLNNVAFTDQHNSVQNIKPAYICTFCHKKRHLRKFCFTLKRARQNNKKRDKQTLFNNNSQVSNEGKSQLETTDDMSIDILNITPPILCVPDTRKEHEDSDTMDKHPQSVGLAHENKSRGKDIISQKIDIDIKNKIKNTELLAPVNDHKQSMTKNDKLLYITSNKSYISETSTTLKVSEVKKEPFNDDNKSVNSNGSLQKSVAPKIDDYEIKEIDNGCFKGSKSKFSRMNISFDRKRSPISQPNFSQILKPLVSNCKTNCQGHEVFNPSFVLLRFLIFQLVVSNVLPMMIYFMRNIPQQGPIKRF